MILWLDVLYKLTSYLSEIEQQGRPLITGSLLLASNYIIIREQVAHKIISLIIHSLVTRPLT
jgi:hypothetical protein